MPLDEEIVRSRANPLFKRLRSLKGRGVEGELCLLEGPTLLGEALDAGVALVEVAVTPAAEERPTVAKLLQRLRGQAVPVRRLAASLLASLSEAQTTQGVVALARPPASDEESLFAGNAARGGGRRRSRIPETSAGSSAPPRAPAPRGRTSPRAAPTPSPGRRCGGPWAAPCGCPWSAAWTTEAVLERLEARGIPIFATTPDGETRYDEADLAGPAAVVFGREGSGLGEDLAPPGGRAGCGFPSRSGVESLNVGVAAGLVLFEAARQRGFPPGDGGERALDHVHEA